MNESKGVIRQCLTVDIRDTRLECIPIVQEEVAYLGDPSVRRCQQQQHYYVLSSSLI